MCIYFKPRDTRLCLLFSSSHPNHCKKNIPFTLARRICTMLENQQQKLRHLLEYLKTKNNLLEYQKRKPKKCDYPANKIIKTINKAPEIPQNKFRKPKEK